MRTIAAWFDRRRGLAIGITLAGAGLGYTYVPPLLQHTIESSGWRPAYYLLSAIILLVALPAVVFFFRESPLESGAQHSAERLPEGDRLRGLTRNQALRTPVFRTLFVVFSLLSFSLYGLMIHSVPMLIDRGMSGPAAALGASTIGVTIMVARVATGYLCDRLFAPKVALAAFALSAAGLALLALGVNGAMAYVALVFIGFSIGAEIDFMTFLTSRYFGIRHFGEIYGILFASLLIGTSIGPVVFGWTYDTTGSYATVLWFAAGASATAAVLSGGLPAYATTGNYNQ
jgi:MFS family permease